MKIDRVELQRVKMTMREPFETSFGVELEKDFFLARIYSDGSKSHDPDHGQVAIAPNLFPGAGRNSNGVGSLKANRHFSDHWRSIHIGKHHLF